MCTDTIIIIIIIIINCSYLCLLDDLAINIKKSVCTIIL